MIDEFLRSILPTNRPRSRGDGHGALWAMYDLVPDSTFSFKRGGEKSSENVRVATTMRDHGQHQTCITMHRTKWRPARRSSRAVRPDRDHQRPGSIPREGKGVKGNTSKHLHAHTRFLLLFWNVHGEKAFLSSSKRRVISIFEYAMLNRGDVN